MISLPPQIARTTTAIANSPTFKYIKKHTSLSIYTPLSLIMISSIIVSSKTFELQKGDVIALINSASSVVLSFAAIHGITSWKRQKTWERQTKAAEEITMLFYKFKDSIGHITSHFSYESIKHENDRGKRARLVAEDRMNRINSYNNLFIEIESKKYEFNLILGDQSKKVIERILSIRNRIINTLHEYVEYTEESVTNTDQATKTDGMIVNGKKISEEYLSSAAQAEAQIKECRHIMYGHNTSPIIKEIEKIEEEVEHIQKKFIRY